MEKHYSTRIQSSEYQNKGKKMGTCKNKQTKRIDGDVRVTGSGTAQPMSIPDFCIPPF